MPFFAGGTASPARSDAAHEQSGRPYPRTAWSSAGCRSRPATTRTRTCRPGGRAGRRQDLSPPWEARSDPLNRRCRSLPSAPDASPWPPCRSSPCTSSVTPPHQWPHRRLRQIEITAGQQYSPGSDAMPRMMTISEGDQHLVAVHVRAGNRGSSREAAVPHSEGRAAGGSAPDAASPPLPTRPETCGRPRIRRWCWARPAPVSSGCSASCTWRRSRCRRRSRRCRSHLVGAVGGQDAARVTRGGSCRRRGGAAAAVAAGGVGEHVYPGRAVVRALVQLFVAVGLDQDCPVRTARRQPGDVRIGLRATVRARSRASAASHTRLTA